MYGSSHSGSGSAPLDDGIGKSLVDGSGTINPAALNSDGSSNSNGVLFVFFFLFSYSIPFLFFQT